MRVDEKQRVNIENSSRCKIVTTDTLSLKVKETNGLTRGPQTSGLKYTFRNQTDLSKYNKDDCDLYVGTRDMTYQGQREKKGLVNRQKDRESERKRRQELNC